MADKVLKFLLRLIVIVWLVRYLLSQLDPIRVDDYLVPIFLLALCLVLVKHWFPPVYNFTKRVIVWTGKTVAGWLWRKPEKKGAANVRQPRMRWRH